MVKVMEHLPNNSITLISQQFAQWGERVLH